MASYFALQMAEVIKVINRKKYRTSDKGKEYGYQEQIKRDGRPEAGGSDG